MIKRFFIALLFAAMVFTACEKDNPVEAEEHDHDHAEAVGLVLSSNGESVVNYTDGEVLGTIELNLNDGAVSYQLQFIAEDGDRFVPEEDHYSLDYEISNNAVFSLLMDQKNDWDFSLEPKQAGSATLVIKIMHGDHADFVSAPLQVEVAN